jgi:integrase/recombinase XerD
MTALGDQATRYLGIRRALGQQLAEPGRLLADFADYCRACQLDHVTVDAAIGWATAGPQLSPSQIARRLSTIRGFATYLAAFDPATEIPPVHLLATGVHRRAPYIFTAAEIDALIRSERRPGCARRYEQPVSPP